MHENQQPNNPLHGVKLQEILEFLHKAYGWEGLGSRIDIRCFNYDPSIKSSLKFLRKTPWARDKVEALYLRSFKEKPITKSKVSLEKNFNSQNKPTTKRKYGFKRNE